MTNYINKQEIDEVVACADEALIHLRNADELLNSAKNWGLFDLFGGGLITTMIKRGKMNDAQEELEAARYAMNQLADELRDVDSSIDLQIDMDGFTAFADYFFDGMIADWFVQSKIEKSRKQVKDAIAQVEGILDAVTDLEYQ